MSASPRVAGEGRVGAFAFRANNVSPLAVTDRAFGDSVRCVQHLPGCLAPPQKKKRTPNGGVRCPGERCREDLRFLGGKRLVNLVTAWDHELKEMMGGMGINSIEALRGNRLMLRGIGLTEKELNILGVAHAGE